MPRLTDDTLRRLEALEATQPSDDNAALWELAERMGLEVPPGATTEHVYNLIVGRILGGTPAPCDDDYYPPLETDPA